MDGVICAVGLFSWSIQLFLQFEPFLTFSISAGQLRRHTIHDSEYKWTSAGRDGNRASRSFDQSNTSRWTTNHVHDSSRGSRTDSSIWSPRRATDLLPTGE